MKLLLSANWGGRFLDSNWRDFGILSGYIFSVPVCQNWQVMLNVTFISSLCCNSEIFPEGDTKLMRQPLIPAHPDCPFPNSSTFRENHRIIILSWNGAPKMFGSCTGQPQVSHHGTENVVQMLWRRNSILNCCRKQSDHIPQRKKWYWGRTGGGYVNSWGQCWGAGPGKLMSVGCDRQRSSLWHGGV